MACSRPTTRSIRWSYTGRRTWARSEAMRTASGPFAERVASAAAADPDNPLVDAVARFVAEGATRSYAPFAA